jgi:hypothetical protein
MDAQELFSFKKVKGYIKKPNKALIMKSLLTITLISAFLLSSCSKEKQTEKMLYGEWEVTSFLHGANDLTQLYKDSCGCRLVFVEYKFYSSKSKTCILKCSFNNWNYYYLDSLIWSPSVAGSPWIGQNFQRTNFEISENRTEISWRFGKNQPTQIFRWGMYPLTINSAPFDYSLNTFQIVEISKKEFTMQYTDSTNIPYFITIKKM